MPDVYFAEHLFKRLSNDMSYKEKQQTNIMAKPHVNYKNIPSWGLAFQELYTRISYDL